MSRKVSNMRFDADMELYKIYAMIYYSISLILCSKKDN